VSNVVSKDEIEQRQRAECAKLWSARESLLLSRMISLFKKRCTQTVEKEESQMTVSFDALCREVPEFPKRIQNGAVYYVRDWSHDAPASSWFYANKGTSQGYAGSQILFAELLECLFPKFMNEVSKLGFSSCSREKGSWRITAVWGTAQNAGAVDLGSFAACLLMLAAERSQEHAQREKSVQQWVAHEAMLLDRAVECFKATCHRAASRKEIEATVSFDSLSRDIPDFPKRALKNGNYYVDQWFGGITASAWFYANKGSKEDYSGAPILFADVLQRMLPMFLSRVKELGFISSDQQKDSWKIRSVWGRDARALDKSFAATLAQEVANRHREEARRCLIAAHWHAHEALLLNRAIETFRNRCTKAAEGQNQQLTISFDALSREVGGFPKRVLKDKVYYVDLSTESFTSESWFYAVKGTGRDHTGAAILFADFLQSLLPKFLLKAQQFGFTSCERVAGTWNVTAVWGKSSKVETAEPAAKRARLAAMMGGA